MALKRLNFLAGSHIPNQRRSIAALTSNSNEINKTIRNCLASLTPIVFTPETNVFPVSDGAKSMLMTSAV